MPISPLAASQKSKGLEGVESVHGMRQGVWVAEEERLEREQVEGERGRS